MYSNDVIMITKCLSIISALLIQCHHTFALISAEYSSSAKQEDPELWNSTTTSLQNKKIVFIGDSVTRYQYLNLIHFIEFGYWNSGPRHVELQKEWPSWKEFFDLGRSRFHGREICDCLREDSEEWTKKSPRENRYYFHETSKLHVIYFSWMPPIALELNRTVIDNLKTNTSGGMTSSIYNAHINMTRSYFNLNRFLLAEVLSLSPDFVIVNQGIWRYGFENLANGSNLIDFAEALKLSSKVSIWKVTTASMYWRYVRPASDVHNNLFLETLKKHGILIFDAYNITASLTGRARENFVDHVHFYPHVYRVLNLELLSIILAYSNS